MTFYDKIKWILGILMIFVLIMATNLIDRNNFLRVRDSVVSIYEDRLVANDLIFEMATVVHQKQLAVAQSDTLFFTATNSQHNNRLIELVARFGNTKLTVQESQVFKDLKEHLERLPQQEALYVSSGFTNQGLLQETFLIVNTHLNELSKIQLSEGSRQMSISKRAMDTVELFTQLEIYILIFLALVMQIIVIYNPKK